MMEIDFEMDAMQVYTIYFVVMMRSWDLGTTSTSEVASLVGNILWTICIETWSGGLVQKASAQQVLVHSIIYFTYSKKL
jgi:hypothetical protein